MSFYEKIRDCDSVCYDIINHTREDLENITTCHVKISSFDNSLIGMKYNNGVWEKVPQPEPEPTQLDRIELQVKTSYTEAQNQAVDQYTEELLEGGIL